MQTRLPAGFRLDVDRARQIAAKLLEAYRTTGIFGNKEMPEDMLPEGVIPGSEEHLRNGAHGRGSPATSAGRKLSIG